MHLFRAFKKMAILFVGLCFMFSILFIHSIPADEMPDSLVDARFNIEFITGIDLKISVEMDVKEINVFDTTYNREEINNIALDIALDRQQILGAIKLRLRDLVKNQIKIIFENANVNALNQIPDYSNYIFLDAFNVNLTSAFFNINETVTADDFINGVLDMGAVISYNFNLQAEPGWNNTFTYILHDSMDFNSANNTANVNIQKTEITWILKNWNGGNANKQVELSLRSKPSVITKSEFEDISLEFELDANSVDNIGLTTTILTKSIDIREYGILPDFVSDLDFVPSDGIRLFVDNDLLSWEDIYLKTISPLEQNTISTIENSSFNQTLETSFSWDYETTTNCSNPYNVTNMDDTPPVKAELIDEAINLNICGMTARAFFGMINAGATANVSAEDINFGDNLGEIGLDYEVFLHLPNNITLETKNIYSWNQSFPFSGEFGSELQPKPKYSKENINVFIEIKIEKMDLNIPSFFTGKTELTATSNIKEDNNLHVITFPERVNISKKINLTFLNSDAFRLCTEESVFSEEDIDVYLANKKDIFEERLSRVLNGLTIKGVIDKDVFFDSLNWDRDISNMDDVIPVIASTYAHNVYPVAFNLSLWPPDLRIFNQSFNLESLENQSVTYRIVFPKGISVAAKDTLNRSIIEGETSDGREYIEITFDSDEGIVTDILLCELAASSLYMLGLFMPCILSLILVIILIIVVYLIRKRRKGGKIKQDETVTTGYEDQDFYVPPPPSSK